MPARARGVSVLIVSRPAFTVCFMVWTMFGVIGVPIRQTLGLNATEFGRLTMRACQREKHVEGRVNTAALKQVGMTALEVEGMHHVTHGK